MLKFLRLKLSRMQIKNAKNRYDTEHVTPYIKRRKKFKKFNLEHNKNLSDLRFTVDQKNDMQLVEYVFKNFNNNFKWEKLIKSQKIKKMSSLNQELIKRDEGASMPLGQKMWLRAKNIIPGGTMLFSKIQIYFFQKMAILFYEGKRMPYLGFRK